jgi:hypothetical protein
MHLLAVRAHEGFEGRQSLGHPGASVKEQTGLAKRGVIDRNSLGTALLEPLERLPEDFGSLLVSAKVESRFRRGRECGRSGVAQSWGFLPLRHGINKGRVFGRQGDERNAVERRAGGHHAGRAEQPGRWLEADNIVGRRGNAAGARRVGPQGKAHKARCHGDSRTRTRSARDVVSIEHIATRPIGTAIAGEARAELIQIHFADRNGTGVQQSLDHGGRALGDI